MQEEKEDKYDGVNDRRHITAHEKMGKMLEWYIEHEKNLSKISKMEESLTEVSKIKETLVEVSATFSFLKDALIASLKRFAAGIFFAITVAATSAIVFAFSPIKNIFDWWK